MNDLIRAKWKEIVEFQDIIKKHDLKNYKSKRGKTYNFSKHSLPLVFSRDIHEGDLSIEKADNKQSNFANELKNFGKGIKTIEKKFFLYNLGLLLFSVSFKTRLFPIKNLNKVPLNEPATEPKGAKESVTEPEVAAKATKANTKRKIFSLKFPEELLNNIKNEEKNINEQIFKDHFFLSESIIFSKKFIW